MPAQIEMRECIVFRERNNYAVCYEAELPLPLCPQLKEDITYWYAGEDKDSLGLTHRRVNKDAYDSPTIYEMDQISKGIDLGGSHYNWRRIAIDDIEHPLLKQQLVRERDIRQRRIDNRTAPEDRPVVSASILRGLKLITAHMNEALEWTEMALAAARADDSYFRASAQNMKPSSDVRMKYGAMDYSMLFFQCKDKADFTKLRKTAYHFSELQIQSKLSSEKTILHGLWLMHNYLTDISEDREPDAVVSYSALHKDSVGTKEDLHAAAVWLMQACAWAEDTKKLKEAKKVA
jgi:hypothetical protein